MSFTITKIKPETIEALNALAAAKGQSAEEYVCELIEAQILASSLPDETAAPVRVDYTRIGMSEKELMIRYNQEREAKQNK